jgi:uncharacterized protein
VSAGRVPFPNGSLSVAELAASFSALQADVTFIDAEGVVRYFSEYRIFSRPAICLNRDVLECHAPATRAGIERMISEFATGWRDEAVFLTHKDGRGVDVRYLAVRDSAGTYLGCLEVATWASP